MGRPMKTAEPATEVIMNTDALATASAATNELAAIDHQAQASTQTLALQLGYDGPLDPDMLEFTVAQNMRRTVEAALDAGRALLLLKERVPHGDFERRLDRTGMAPRAAQRLMQACLKFSNASPATHLNRAIGNTSKLIELLVLDDDEVQQLTEEGSVHGITLDDIERMGPKDLRRALREAREDLAAKDDLVTAKNEKIDKLLSRKRWKPSADGLAQTEAEQGMLDHLAQVTRGMELAVAQFDVACLEVLSEAPAPIRQRASDAVQYVLARLGELVSHHALEVDLQAARLERPDWLDELGGADAASPAAGGTAG
jgi:hypothetical protein